METINQPEMKTAKPKNKKKLVVFVVALVVIVLAAAGLYWYLQKNQSTQNSDNTTVSSGVNSSTNNAANSTSNSATNSQAASPSAETVTYTNSVYKFSLTYPKTYEDYGNCDDVKKVRDAIDLNQSRPAISSVAVKVFEVPGENKLYIAPEKTIEIKMYQVEDSSRYNFDYTSCKVVPTTVDILQHWDDNLGDVTVLRPTMLEQPLDIYYKTIQSDADFIALYTDKVYSLKDGCAVTKTPTSADPNIDTIAITGGEACYSGGAAPTLYKYSTVSKTAVLTGGYQILPFGMEDSFIQFTE